MVTTMKSVASFLVFVLFLFNCKPASAEEISGEKQADIKQLLEMTGTIQLGKQLANYLVVAQTQSLKKINSNIPPEVLDHMPEDVAEIINENIDSLLQPMIEIYDKHFTASEIKELIGFYSTSTGQKIISKGPMLMQEGILIGQRWGESLGPQIQKKIMERLNK